jgi:hypothetical protein
MKTVWKFPFAIGGEQPINLPAGSEVLHVGLDPDGAPCLWARVDSHAPKVTHTLYVTGTGHPIPEGDNRHLGTFINGPFVWHVWMPS